MYGALKATIAIFLLAGLNFPAPIFSQADTARALALLEQEARLAPAVSAGLFLSSSYTDDHTGVSHYYWQQRFHGLPVAGAVASIHLSPQGEMISHQARIWNKVPPAPVFSLAATAARDIVRARHAVAADSITLARAWELDEQGRQRAAHIVTWYGPGLQHIYRYAIDGQSGQVLSRRDLVVHCSFEHGGSAGVHTHGRAGLPLAESAFAAPPSVTGQYYFLPAPVESPLYGSRVLRTGASLIDNQASPFGWHSTQDQATPQFTYTRGNNVYAYYGVDNSGVPVAVPITRDPFTNTYLGGNVPNGGAELNFDFQQDLNTANPTDFLESAITNLFVWNNLMHDVLWKYGFNEAAGNFQATNTTGQGLGNDFVLAEAQDGSGVNNANMAVFPDGRSPVMQMYLWNTGLPGKAIDGDFDNLIISHEYTHGLIFRLVGGPATTSCMTNFEQPSEGICDFIGLLMTMQDADGDGILEENVTGEGIRTIGSFVRNTGVQGQGLRNYPYATSMGLNPVTYADVPGLSAPHGVGQVWGSVLWDMCWRLIERYGLGDIQNPVGGGGNVKAMRLVVESLRYLPCSPSFVDMRDAILQANDLLYNSEDEALLWSVFARRGLGVGATSGGNASFKEPELDMVKTSNRLEAEPGDPVIYTLTVNNNTGRPFYGTLIQDTLPPGIEFVSAANGGFLSNGVVYFPVFAQIPDGGSKSVSFTATPSPAAPVSERLFREDFEGVLPSGGQTAGSWIPDADNPYEGERSFFHPNPPVPSLGSFIVAMQLLPGMNNHLRFYHSYNTEETFDGGIVEIYYNGQWRDLGNRMRLNGYNHIIRGRSAGGTIPSSVLQGRSAFSGNSGGYIPTVINLRGFTGEVLIRFTFASDGAGAGEGWFVDDIVLYDLESQVNSAWTRTMQGFEGGATDSDVGLIFLPAAQAALPVDWLSFEARTTTAGVELQWSTAREQDNRGFTVERSEDGGRSFADLDFLPAGNGQYRYTDQLARNGQRYWYRVRQEDHDGSFTYSPVRTIRAEDRDAGIRLFPNPATDQLQLLLPAQAEEKLELRILDAAGRVCLRRELRGEYRPSLSLYGLPAGHYWVRLTGAQTQWEGRFIKVE